MKLDKFTEQDFLDLLNKTKDEQIKWLTDRGILNGYDRDIQHPVWGCTAKYTQQESLADLAERLWEKAMKQGTTLTVAMVHVADYCEKKKIIATQVFHWFCYYAKPIHRIVASLIALQRSEVEV